MADATTPMQISIDKKTDESEKEKLEKSIQFSNNINFASDNDKQTSTKTEYSQSKQTPNTKIGPGDKKNEEGKKSNQNTDDSISTISFNDQISRNETKIKNGIKIINENNFLNSNNNINYLKNVGQPQEKDKNINNNDNKKKNEEKEKEKNQNNPNDNNILNDNRSKLINIKKNDTQNKSNENKAYDNKNNSDSKIKDKEDNNNVINNDNKNIVNLNQNNINNNNEIGANNKYSNNKKNEMEVDINNNMNNNEKSNKNENNEELNTLIDTIKKEKHIDIKIEPNEQKKYSFSRYTKAPKTGLINLGNTSYLNAVLQLLGSIKNIASSFLNPETKDLIYKDIKKYPLSFVIQRLFLHLYPYPEIKDRQIYKPDSILLILGALNVVYKSKNRRNPNDLISFILNTIHSELIQIKEDMQTLNPDIYDRKKVINCGIINYNKNNNSIISNYLNWFEIKESKCPTCKTIFSFNTFNVFELDILETFKYRQNNPITINDCLKYYEKPKKTNIVCKKCGKNKISNFPKILSSSHFLIFSLNRGDFDKNLIDIPFTIEDKIDLTPFTEGAIKSYELNGIVSITKDKEGKDIYVSFCRSPVDNQWYLYNDEKVQEIQLDQIINGHNNNKQYIPCILVYKQHSTK